MNSAKLIDLFINGACFVVKESRIYHPSFKKGWRKMLSSDISFCAAAKILGNKLSFVDGIYKVNA